MVKNKFSVEVGMYPHKMSVGGTLRVMGYYVYVGGLFGGGVQTEAEFQFVGMHKCLCFTLDKPDSIGNVVTLADEGMKVGNSSILWLGKVKWYDTHGGGFKYYLSDKVWGLNKILKGRKLVTTANVRKVMGKGGRSYVVLSVPKLSRTGIRKNKK